MRTFRKDVVFAAGIVLAVVAFSACQPDGSAPDDRSTDENAVKIDEAAIKLDEDDEDEDGVKVDKDAVTIMEVTVGPRLLDCVGVGPMKCLEVNGGLFYDGINGFEYEEGYSYRLKIERYEAYPGREPPQDASRYGYRLIEVLGKTAQ